MTDPNLELVIPTPPPLPPPPNPLSPLPELDDDEDPFKEKRFQKELQFRTVGAIERADNSSLECYVKSGVDTNAKIQLVKTPLTLAVEQDEISTDIISTLLDGGADPNLPDFTPQSLAPLHILAFRGDLEPIEIFINRSTSWSCDLEIKDKAGCTPLHYAAKYGNLEMVEFLLQQGVDIHARDTSGCSALHRACESLHYKTAEYLIRQGHDVNAADNFNWTPLFYSVFFTHTEMVRLLLKLGADLTVLDTLGNSVLNAVCYCQQFSNNFYPVHRIVSTSFDYYQRAWSIPPQELKDYLMKDEEYWHLQAEPDTRHLQAEPDTRRLQAEPDTRRLQAEPDTRRLQAEPNTRRLQLLKVLINAGVDPNLYPSNGPALLEFGEYAKMRLYSILAGSKLSPDEHMVLADTHLPDLLSWFQTELTEQYSLKRQCSNTIRKHLTFTRDINGAIGELPIPSAMKHYLRLDEFDDLLIRG